MPPTYKRKKDGFQRLQAVADDELKLPRLTLKQERFVHHILSGNKTAKESYRLAFDCKDMADDTISAQASRLLNSAKIAASIRSRQRIGLYEAAVNRENHLAELSRLRELAVENQQISAGVQAEHYRGRVAGLYNDKLSLQVGPSDAVLLTQIASLLGADMAQAVGNAIGIGDQAESSNDDSADSALLKLAPPLDG